MNKKFLSAILFGALMVTSTGTFVSCKDYDDDIENLQEQINKLATKEDMTSQIASLQSALTAAQGEAAAAKATAAQALDKANSIAATATDAEKAAAEAEKAAAKAALDAAAAKEEAIKAAQEEVAKAQKALQEAIAADFEAVKKDLAAQIAKLTEKVEAMTGYTTEMVTDINIEYVYPVNGDEDQNGKVFGAFDEMLDLNYAKVKTIAVPKGLKENITQKPGYDYPSSYEFGKGMPGAFTVNKGDVNTVQDNLLINVAPVNAAIPAESLSLINSKGDNLNEYVDITISNYEGLLTGYGYGSRTVASTGLRQVGVQLKNTVDFESFDKKVIADEGYEHNTGADDEENCGYSHEYVLHALAATDSKGRAVNSEFDIKLHVQKENSADEINAFSYLSSSAYVGKSELYNHHVALDGQREEGSFPIVLNEDFTLEVGSVNGRVMASYVELDSENSWLSETDKKALKLITVSGDKKVVKNGIHNLAVGGDAEGMPVPFKLVTIDYTGRVTVIPFWVKAEAPALMSATFTITPATYVDTPTAWAQNSTMEEFKVPATAAKFLINLTVGEENHQEAVVFDSEDYEYIDDITNYFNLYKSNKSTPATVNSESARKAVAYAQFKGELNLQVMREDKAYEGVIKFYAENGSYLGSNAISVKKVLPTVIKKGLSAKENAINAGVLTVYPVPGEAAEFELANAFNFENEIAEDNNLQFNTKTFIASNGAVLAKYGDKDSEGVVDQTARTIIINNVNIIDGTTKFPTTVTYNYGDIKYHAEGHGVEDPEECVVEWNTKFDVVFSCYPVDCTYSWYNTPVVYYKEAVTLDGHARKADGTITEKRNVIKVLDPYAKEVNAFSTVSTNPWLTWAETLNSYEIVLWTNGDKAKVNEFFTPSWAFDDANGGKVVIKLEPTSTDVKLSGDVQMTVVVKISDKFGHTPAHEVKALTFTMKKDHVVAE